MSQNNMNKKPPLHQRKHGPGGGPPGMMPGEKPKEFKKSMRKLLEHLRPFYTKIIVVFIFSIASTVFAIIGPKIVGKATTEIFNGLIAKVSGLGNIDFEKITNFMWQLIALYIVSALFSFIQSFIMTGVSQKIAFNFRRQMSEKINRLPLKYFDTKTHGEVLSRVTNDVDTIAQSLGTGLTQIVSSITMIIGVFCMMMSISPLMTLVAMLIAPLSLVFVLIIIKLSQKYFKMQQEYLGHVNGQVEEVYGGHSIMKVFNAEERALIKFNEDNDKLYQSGWKSQAFSGAMMPLMGFVGNLGYVGVSLLGSFLAIRKTIEVGDIISFIQYIRMFTQPISQMAQIANILQSTVAAAERVFEFLEETEEQKDTANPESTENITGTVTFEHVHFGYNPDKIIINDFSATIRPGQRIAIVGPTGAGKTTIVKLLMRFYELNSGKITIDGININDFKRDELRGLIGMVLQDTWLYNGTIMDNIRFGRLDASDQEIIDAGKAAHIDHFVRTLPNTYHMVLDEEASNISQGQKQLLTIARAILANPKILILDEATSSVDTRTEVRIQKAMNNLMKGRTCFIIAHRLSTIRDADLILVMKDGDIVEQGNHETLLIQNGFYANLYKSQFESGLVS